MRSVCWLLLCCAILSGLAIQARAQSQAEPLQPGEFRLDCEAGFQSYAFPIADAALARRWTSFRFEGDEANWARRGDMAYQLAYDYSVLPVHVRIEHRRPDAFAGTIELETAHGYGPSEDPLGHRTVLRQDFVAPPSVPLEFTLAPRVVPLSRPGNSERLLVRVFQKGVARPIHQRQLTVTQLEPSHLYSLILDGSGTSSQAINPGNYLQLHVPGRNIDSLDPSIYSSSHWYIGVPHRAVTGLPLAARQFAFVVADLEDVSSWEIEEQDKLVEFLLGGGRLLLYHATGNDWQGLSLSKPTPVGRGWLIPVAGDLAASQKTARTWLEGEMEEFTLYAKGTVRGYRANEDFFNAFSDNNLQLDEVYGPLPAGAPITPLSHRPGYLHPLWLYRSAVDCGAIEPWDYPEFTQFSKDDSHGNTLLQSTLGAQPSAQLPRSLPQLLTSQRHLPAWWVYGLVGLELLMLALTLERGSGYALKLIAATSSASLASGAMWLISQPIAHPRGEMRLRDSDERVRTNLQRSVTAQFCNGIDDCGFDLPSGALLRRVDWQPAGHWQLQGESTAEGQSPMRWSGTSSGAGPLVSLRSEASAEAIPLGFLVSAEAVSHGYSITLDASHLPPGQLILAQSSLGWTALKAGPAPLRFYLYLPDLPAHPGVARFSAIQGLAESWGRQVRTLKSAANWQSRRLLAQLLEAGWTEDLKPGAPGSDVLRLGWSAILQDPLGGRGLPVDQLVIYTVVPEDLSGSTEVGATWIRHCVPLP